MASDNKDTAANKSRGQRSRRSCAPEDSSNAATKLRETLEEVVTVLATIVEYRDPYTAGHQSRVADLAVAIGSALGMDEDRLEGLRIASTLHDLGKVAVPAEILTRPGRLSDVELAIARTHVAAGYRIIKGINFPWPIAEIIYQHAERLDGSGYPRGLQGTQIVQEARILAVADIIEAMTSHRPYRSAQSLEAALTQVREDAGTKLDADVVAVTCRLFEQKHFCFSG